MALKYLVKMTVLKLDELTYLRTNKKSQGSDFLSKISIRYQYKSVVFK